MIGIDDNQIDDTLDIEDNPIIIEAIEAVNKLNQEIIDKEEGITDYYQELAPFDFHSNGDDMSITFLGNYQLWSFLDQLDEGTSIEDCLLQEVQELLIRLNNIFKK